MPAPSATTQLTVNPTPIATATAASGPTIGTSSTRPAKTAISSQYGSPSSQKANDSSVATMRTSTNCPRTKAPSFMSIRTQVSRVTRRCWRGTRDCTSAIVESRSKIQ